MTTWLYALCGKEHDLLPFFLRHYSPEVERIILLDGGMDQATVDIASGFANVEIQPTLFADEYDEEFYTRWISEKYKEARGKVDWVLWVDIDEFLYSGESLRATLDEYRTREILAVQCDGYQMAADNFPHGATSLTDAVKVGAYDKIYNKVAAFDPRLSVRWSVGRHSCDIDGLYPTPTGLKLLHYRYFGDEWLRERNKHNHARKSQKDLQMGYGYHVAPDYDGGRYSPAWFKQILDYGKEVI